MEFDLNISDLQKLERFARRAPAQFRQVSAGVLNTVAFRVRGEMISEITRRLTVRSANFVSGSIRFTKTKSGPVSSQRSRAGSIARPRFSGWIEQQTGKAPVMNRVATPASRGKSYSKKMKNTARLRGNIQKATNFPGKNKRQKTAVMLSMMRRGTAERRPFIIDENLGGKMRTLSRGLYGWRGRKISKTQTFGKRYSPKKISWAHNATKNFFSKNSFRRVVSDEIDKMFKTLK